MSGRVIEIGTSRRWAVSGRGETNSEHPGVSHRRAFVAAATAIVGLGVAAMFVQPPRTGWQYETWSTGTAYCPAPSAAPAPTVGLP